MATWRSRTFLGKHVYVLDGVKYLKKKEAVKSVCSFLKQSNGRYYVSLENYQLGRKLYWKRKFISSVRQLIMKKKENMIAWRNTIAGAKHRQRCEQLISQLRGWLVGCFGFNGPLRQYFSLYRAVSQREGEGGEKG